MPLTPYPSRHLPEHRSRWIADRGRLSVRDFGRSVVTLKFADGSSATFLYAFYVADETRRELAVFTEDCGYHVFQLDALDAYERGEM